MTRSVCKPQSLKPDSELKFIIANCHAISNKLAELQSWIYLLCKAKPSRGKHLRFLWSLTLLQMFSHKSMTVSIGIISIQTCYCEGFPTINFFSLWPQKIPPQKFCLSYMVFELDIFLGTESLLILIQSSSHVITTCTGRIETNMEEVFLSS